MIVKIKAKSSETSPRILTINQKPIYIIDRRDGFRLTVFNRDTFKVMGDANFSSFSEAYNSFMKYYNIPGYIGVINGHGKGNVVVAIIDPNTQNKIIRKGDKEVYAEYIVNVKSTGEEIKKIVQAEANAAEIAQSIDLERPQSQFPVKLLYIALPLIAGIILFKVLKKD